MKRLDLTSKMEIYLFVKGVSQEELQFGEMGQMI